MSEESANYLSRLHKNGTFSSKNLLNTQNRGRFSQTYDKIVHSMLYLSP
jgi:hypothetical protein